MLEFTDLQAQLRRITLARISARQISGLELARKTGFQQAHISNFLRSRRGLSLEGMDKLLKTLGLSLLDLVPAGELNSYLPGGLSDREYAGVALVDAAALADPVPAQKHIHERLKFKRTFLRRLRADLIGPRQEWTRFLLMRATPEDGLAMYPRIIPGATVLIDRHYNSLRPYRRGDQNMYAVRRGDTVLLRYVEITGRQLTLRPQLGSCPLDFVMIEGGRSYSDYLVGRICHVSVET